jgi:uncharacterized repeat protein (TIGR01451 family)
VLARIVPYRRTAEPGEAVRYTVTLRNPHPTVADATLRLVLPDGFRADPPSLERTMGAGEEAELDFDVRVGPRPVRRARIAVDVTIGDLRLGQHAEALVTVVPPGSADAPPPAAVPAAAPPIDPTDRTERPDP